MAVDLPSYPSQFHEKYSAMTAAKAHHLAQKKKDRELGQHHDTGLGPKSPRAHHPMGILAMRGKYLFVQDKYYAQMHAEPQLFQARAREGLGQGLAHAGTTVESMPLGCANFEIY